MGFSQVPRQVRRAPTLVLRAVFAGIGRIVLPAERPLANAGKAEADDGQRPRQLSARRQLPSAAPVAPPGSRWRSLDKTGNVRLLSDEDVDDDYDVPPEPGRSGAGRKSAAARIADPPDEARRSSASAQTLPLANYDELSLASIRARLRGLDVSQLRVLAEYESKNAERPEVLGMFDRRISKLEAGE
jgi:hypothetical protein